MNKQSIVAWLLNCEVDDLIKFHDYGDHVTVINQAGYKVTFREVELRKAEKDMAMDKFAIRAAEDHAIDSA